MMDVVCVKCIICCCLFFVIYILVDTYMSFLERGRELIAASGICLSCFQLIIPSGKRNVGARRSCLSCRSYKLSFCVLQLPNASGICFQLIIPSGKRNVGARRSCLSCRSYKLSFCVLQLPNAKSQLSLITFTRLCQWDFVSFLGRFFA